MSRRHILVILFLYASLAYVDRQIIGLTLDPIGKEFGLMDWQLGLLSGVAFTIIFAIASLPCSLLVAKIDRRKILSFSVGFWSLCTFFAGLTTSFAQVFITRVGVGLGESASQPTAMFVLSDLFKARERATALSLFSIAGVFGAGVALLVGGIATQNLGWRAAMIIVGFPGIILSVYIFFFMPKSGGAVRSSAENEVAVSKRIFDFSEITDTAKRMWRSKASRFVFFSHLIGAVSSFATITWLPTFLTRTHDLAISTVGIYLALTLLIGGPLVTWSVAAISQNLGLRYQLWLPLFPAIAVLATKPLVLYAYLTDNVIHCLIGLGVMVAFGVSRAGPSLAVVQAEIPRQKRGISIAILFAAVHLIGMPLGAFLVGFLSDYYGGLGYNGLRVGVILIQSFSIVSIVFLFIAAVSLRHRKGPLEDVEDMQGLV